MAKGKYERWLEPDGLILLEGWARDGLTDEQIADNCDIGTTTLYRWKSDYWEIREALKKGKEVADYEVENALFKRALGYRYDEITSEYVEGEQIETKRVTKEIAPDVGAIAFWLKNRRKDKWRDRPPDETDRKALDEIKRLLGVVDSAF